MPNQNDTRQKNKLHDTLITTLKDVYEFKKEAGILEGYSSLLDTTIRKSKNASETTRLIAPIDRSVAEQVLLVHKAQDVLSKYLKIKPFILDVHVAQMAKNIGLTSSDAQDKMREDIKKEMEENLTHLTNLSARLASDKASSLDKGLAYNELKALIQDLTYRIKAYHPYYQSYLIDKESESETVYAMN